MYFAQWSTNFCDYIYILNVAVSIEVKKTHVLLRSVVYIKSIIGGTDVL